MRERLCLITGATSGVGEATALALAARGARVVVHGRSRERCLATRARIAAETGRESDFLVADLSTRAGVGQLAAAFLERWERLDLLVNNAACVSRRRRGTPDGLELTFAVNHLAVFELTDLMLGALKAAAPSRVVTVSSEMHRRARLDFDDLQSERGYRAWKAYADTKLLNLLFNHELARRLEGTGVTATAAHPGLVRSRIASNGGLGRAVRLFFRLFGMAPGRSAANVLAAVDAPPESNGAYFVQGSVKEPSAAASDEAAAAALWDLSLGLYRREKQ